MAFKNALCLARIPEYWNGLSVRHAACQRHANHTGTHRSWSREWKDEDKVSKKRLTPVRDL